MPKLRVRTNVSARDYEVTIGRGTLLQAGEIARKNLGSTAIKIALVSNAEVFSLYGPTVVESLKDHGFDVFHTLLPKGEPQKSFKTAEKIIKFFTLCKLDRSDGVIALGGGVVGDVTGFAASIYLRGLPFFQIPTTLLAQIDASIGGKTAVNLPSGKNLAGTFHQPQAVVIDVQTLVTLPSREFISGCCEMLKQATVGSKKLFDQTTRFLQESTPHKIKVSRKLQDLVFEHCAFKASLVAQDEQENVTRTDHRSRRILNFGHTIGHALEAVTGFRYFLHGEAVGHGMLAAGALSKNLGMLKESELKLLTEAVRLCGPLPAANDLDQESILAAIQTDKKRVAGENQWVLLERIGRARIVNGKDINPLLIKKSLREALQRIPQRG